MRHPIEDYTVVDVSRGIPGSYATKVLADAGATVVRVEPPTGDPLRRWTATRAPLAPGEDGALWRYLNCSKQSVVVDAASTNDLEMLAALLASADAIVWSEPTIVATPELALDRVRAVAMDASITAITNFGLRTSWSGRPANEFTLQAWSGSVAQRGSPDRPPVVAGARLGDWLTGMLAAVGTLIARWNQLRTNTASLVDVSALECHMLTLATMYPVTYNSIAGHPIKLVRTRLFPDIEQASDGLVGFMPATGQQWLDFCAMVGRPDWAEDESLIYLQNRLLRRAELGPIISEWMQQCTVDEIVELASAMRIPVAPVGNGATTPSFDHLRDGKFYEPNPTGGFIQPSVPYRFHTGPQPRPFEKPPLLGEHNELHRHRQPRRARRSSDDASPATRPFDGVRIADFTTFWAGPIIGNILGQFGADVIHVESALRPDAIRYNTVRTFEDDHWWEWAPLYQGANTDKRGLTIDMGSELGREVALRLIATCDAVVENYSPRVFDQWGLTYEELRQVRPDIIFLRAPAFGLRGPWRDRTGYAQTQEQISGLAWLTGYPDEDPQSVNGVCDPIAGAHATIALLLALEHRRRTGEGSFIEVPMVAGALQLAAEQVVEYSAYGRLLSRMGNRSLTAAPQGIYRTNDIDERAAQERYVAISVESDEQWRSLTQVTGIGRGSDRWATLEARRAAQDELDRELERWCSQHSADEIVERLWTVGVPVAKVLMDYEQVLPASVGEREFFETVHQSVIGPYLASTFPARFHPDIRARPRRAAPALGEHNEEILSEIGYSAEEIDQLARAGVIGSRPPARDRAPARGMDA
ncbi:MAG TPA: CoA transferase [Acidimicrobiales bacterium]